MRKGSLIVLSGPSGVGKGTVRDKLMENFDQIEYSVSVTTRPRREGEVDGVDYFFVSSDKFFQMVEENKFIEWAEVHNNYYGTPKEYVDKTLQSGNDIILEIDIQGARMVSNIYPDAVYVFLVPPSFDELEHRLDKRGTENNKNKALRLKNAREELKELERYDYQIVNDKLEETVYKLKCIIIAEKCRIK
ncbi:MAG: guanylate kinase [Halanaerobiaceae bacterium]